MPSIRELVESLNNPAPELPDVEEIGNVEESWTRKEDQNEDDDQADAQPLRSKRFRRTVFDDDDVGKAVNVDDIFTGEGISGISQKPNIDDSDDGEDEETDEGDLGSNDDEEYSFEGDEDSYSEDAVVRTEAEGSESGGQKSGSESDEVDRIKLSDVIASSNLEQQVNKGKCVLRQMNIFEKLMHLQIKTHSTLRAYNRLPRGAYAKQLLKLADENTVKQYKEARKSMFKFLETLLVIEDMLLSSSKQTEPVMGNGKVDGNVTSDEEIESSDDGDDGIDDNKDDDDDVDEGGDSSSLEIDDDGEDVLKKTGNRNKRRNLNQLNKQLKRREDRFTDFRKQTLLKWDERTQLTGIGKLGKRISTNFDPVVLKQIDQIMSDKRRLIRRTQIKRSDMERIGGDPEATSDSEIFDDDDFYQQLLRDLIERKTTNTSDPIEISRQWIRVQQLRQKRSKKKTVDTKASKGRKIRYVVIPKLVNYFPSTPESIGWSHEMRNQLFKSLFTSTV